MILVHTSRSRLLFFGNMCCFSSVIFFSRNLLFQNQNFSNPKRFVKKKKKIEQPKFGSNKPGLLCPRVCFFLLVSVSLTYVNSFVIYECFRFFRDGVLPLKKFKNQTHLSLATTHKTLYTTFCKSSSWRFPMRIITSLRKVRRQKRKRNQIHR